MYRESIGAKSPFGSVISQIMFLNKFKENDLCESGFLKNECSKA